MTTAENISSCSDSWAKMYLRNSKEVEKKMR